MNPNCNSNAVHFESVEAGRYTPLWFRISSLLLLLIAIVLLLAVLSDRVYTSNFASVALTTILAALGSAAFLHIQAWYGERQSVQTIEREFSSIYRHALEGILILDDHGVCLDANPAALALLGASTATLIGHSFAQFYEDQQLFERQWRSFRERRHQRRHAELLCANGSKVIVNYTAASYLPGRHIIILCDITERVEAQDSLRESRERLQQISDNIHEVVWMMDAPTKKLLVVNRAYETITGHSLESVIADPSSYVEMIHPADLAHVIAKLEGAVLSGHFDEEFRILRPDDEIRWVWVKANPLPHEGPVVRKLVGTAQDITAKKLADAQVAAHLLAAETARDHADAARAEAEALRKATLALTQNLRMDAVLDTLLVCAREIIPYDSASVILAEAEGRLFVARESPSAPSGRSVFTIESSQDALLQRVLLTKKNVHLPDTHEDASWHGSRTLEKIGSWIAVPLVASDSVLGLLSIGSALPRSLTTEHFRRAKSLAIPAAIAIQNARLYEWAEIYAAERQQLLKQVNGLQSPESNVKQC